MATTKPADDRPDTTLYGYVAMAGLLAPVGGLLAWLTIATASVLVANDVPSVPVIAPPSRPTMILFVLLGLATVGFAQRRKSTILRKHHRARQTAELTRDLLRAVGVDAPHAVGTGRRYRGLVPTDLTITAHIARGQWDTLADRFASLTGSDPERVKVTTNKHGTRVREVSPDPEPEPQTAPATVPQLADEAAPSVLSPEDSLPWVDQGPAVSPDKPANEEAVGRMAKEAEGALKMAAGSITIEPRRTTKAGVPTEMAVVYPVGQTTAIRGQLGSLAEAIASTFPPVNGAWVMQWEPTKTRILMRDVRDELRRPVPLPPLEDDLDPADGITLGLTETGEPWRVPIGNGSHIALVGATGAGKGSVVWGVIRGLAPMAERGVARLWVVDPKGGQELGDLEGVVHEFAVSDEETVELLESAVAAMQAKAAANRVAGRRKIATYTRDMPLDVIVIDEATGPLDSGDTALIKRYKTCIAKLMREGRSIGVCVMLATQDPRKDALPSRHLCTVRIGLKTNEAADVDMVLGRGTRAAGALCDRIPTDMQGTGYVMVDGMAGAQRVRAAYVSDDDIPEIAAIYRKGKKALLAPPEHTDAPLGRVEQAALYDAQDREQEQERRAPRRATAPVTAPEPESVEWVKVRELADTVLDSAAYVRLEEGDEVVKVVAMEPSPDVDGDWRLTYLYATDVTSRLVDLPSDEDLEAADEADFAA